jgi:hypothetical protein
MPQKQLPAGTARSLCDVMVSAFVFSGISRPPAIIAGNRVNLDGQYR